ncbi:MAG: hypothetical protein QOJ63_3314 [Solirubrobacteraceae bacterium]|nr:hypothetical protein [Solirubrobacteraceae bacterium]
MGRTDDERLTRLLGDPELAWLVDRVRRRLELGLELDTTVTLADASISQRQAVHRLLGRRPRSGRALGVSLPALDAVIRRSGACPDGLAAASSLLGGCVSTRADAERAIAAAWDGAFATLEQTVAVSPRQELARWLADVRASGLVKRLEPEPESARVLLDRLARVVGALPVDGEPIGRFASRTAGSSHALDDGEPLATLTLGAARAISRFRERQVDESPATWRREVLGAVGLLRDELSSLVLCGGLPGDAASVTGRILAAGSDGGQPVALTLRQLVSHPPQWARRLRGLDVRVCENPVLLQMAADRFGPRCPPLVCTSGQPGMAVMVLLGRLVEAGARLSHHGDFDWGGVRIGNVLHARLRIGPWRFDSSAYEQHVAAHAGPPLRGSPATARWDEGLSVAMLAAGSAVEEESIADSLLDDLETSASHPASG